LLLLAVAEALLRLVGAGHPAAFTVACEAGGVPAYCDNGRFAWRFFPPRIARAPWSFAFPREKAAGSYRIFVLGGSAAQGDPDPTYGVSRILRVLLEDRHPETRFEVINAGVAAINSHVVLPIARDLARRDGDLFVVYLGNNEVVGPFGAGTVFSPLSSSLAAIRTSVFVRGTRIGQLATGGLSALRYADAPEQWRGLEMFLDKTIRVDDPRMESVYGHFRENLEEIVEVARASGAEVIISTVGTNLADCAPFASLHRPDLSAAERREWEALSEAGTLRAFLDAERIDDSFADLEFRIAGLLRANGEHSEANERFVKARDLDALRFRADSTINAIVRDVAGATGARLLEAEELFEKASPHGTPGAGLFHEHVHMNFAGNYLLARALLEEIEPLLPQAAAPGAPLEEEEVARRLAYTRFDRRRVATALYERLARPPFTNQSSHELEVGRLRSEIEEVDGPDLPAESMRAYAGAIAARPFDPWLRNNHGYLLGSMGDHEGAAVEYRAFLEALPRDVPAREKLASALAAQGRFDEAIVECDRVIEAAPHMPEPRYTTAYALAMLSRFDESVAAYEALLSIDPSSSGRIYNEIGRIETHRGRTDEAREAFRRARATDVPLR